MTFRRVGAFAAPLGALYLVVVVLAWTFQRRLLYVAAGRADLDPPPGVTLTTYVAADGVPVHALELDAPGSTQTIVYFHGNGEVVGDDVPLARALVGQGLSVVLLEYRGYGHSQPGSPTEAGLYADAEAVLRALEARGVGPDRVVLWGSSLGTGIAAEMATRGRGSALVLVSPYTSMPDVAAFHLPWLPARLLVRDRFDTLHKSGEIHVPTVVVHGSLDEVVPCAMGERVAAAIPGARFVAVSGGTHNGLFAGERGAGLIAEITRAVRGASKTP
jgi:uncharacterized protein